MDRGTVCGHRVSLDAKLKVVVVDDKLNGRWATDPSETFRSRIDNMNACLRVFGEEPTLLDRNLLEFHGIGRDRACALRVTQYVQWSKRERHV